jgi:reactive intermediate/imine deaminase
VIGDRPEGSIRAQPGSAGHRSLVTDHHPLESGASLPQDLPVKRTIVATHHAPAAIGPYSQAVRAGATVYLSGQIPLDPSTGELVGGPIDAQARRVFENLKAVAAAAGATLDDAVRVTIYLTDLGHFAAVNAVMAEYFREPYPARVTIGVASLPKGAAVEVDCVLVTA